MASETRAGSAGLASAAPPQDEEPSVAEEVAEAVSEMSGDTPTTPAFITPEPEPVLEPDPFPPSSRALRFLAALAVIYTLYFARAILLPVALAIVLSLLLRPIVRWLSRHRIPETAGASICLLALAALLTIGVMQLVQPAKELVAEFPGMMARASVKLRGITSQFSQISEAKEKIEKIAAGEEADQATPVMVQQPGLTSNALLVSATGEFLASAGIIVVLTFFLLTSGDQLINNILTTMPTFRDKRKFVELIQNVQKGVSAYLFTVTIINVGLGVATAIEMWLLGLPNPILWGVLAMTLNFIPFLGPLICGLLIGLASLLAFQSPSYALLAPTLFYVTAALEGNIVTPALLGKRMSLSPILVIVYLTFWGWMWGAGGALLAVPLLAATKIYCDQFEETQPLGTMLSG